MARIKGEVQEDSGVSRLSDGTEKVARMTADGSLVFMDWRMAMVDEGRAFVVNVGAFSSPVTGGGTEGVVIDLNAPEFCLDIPNGVSVWPKRIQVAVQPGAIGADQNETEIVIGIDQDAGVNPGTPGTAVAETIYNLNTLHSRASRCTAKSLYSADMGSATIDIELARAVREIDTATLGVVLQGFELEYEPLAPPKINGPAKLMVYFGGTVAALGFATVEWYELPE